jgi:heme-degrading monooxygenase HmoA
MVVVVFRARIRPGAEQALASLGARMYELAAAMPGYISYKDFVAEDGENVSIIEFDSLEAVSAWREHPEHKIAQQRGRGELFSEFRIQVCTQARVSEFR